MRCSKHNQNYRPGSSDTGVGFGGEGTGRRDVGGEPGVAGVTMAFETSDLRLTSESVRCGTHMKAPGEAGVPGKVVKVAFVLAGDGKTGSASEGVACAAASGRLLIAASRGRARDARSPASALPYTAAGSSSRCSVAASASIRLHPPAPPPSSSAAACACFVCAARRRGDTHSDEPAEDKSSESSSTIRMAAPASALASISDWISSIPGPSPARFHLSALHPTTPASHKRAPSSSCSVGLCEEGIAGPSASISARCNMLSRQSADNSSSSSRKGYSRASSSRKLGALELAKGSLSALSSSSSVSALSAARRCATSLRRKFAKRIQLYKSSWRDRTSCFRSH